MNFIRGTFETGSFLKVATSMLSPPRNMIVTPVQDPTLRTLRSFGFLNLKEGPWVAGGAVRRLLLGLPMGGDIDIFETKTEKTEINENGRSRTSRILSSRDDINYKGNSTPDVENFELKKSNIERKIQLIAKPEYVSVEKLISDFDFTVCMAATDGFEWIADTRLFTHHAEKRLVLNENFVNRNGRSNRLAKYAAYGYNPDPGVMEKVLQLDNPVLDLFDARGFMDGKKETVNSI